ncbi:MAG: 50S ribosomal protein L32 [Candidatus Yonathbacteria bacterium RIFOXYC1_FULL_52_10]|uniref:Large ribosomal subunit protein bL32 n=1 Tax=Candidatus Yonathbacteria bacterium RIFOXYD1_FULL_52_36 TaxID=1802730 RepID=A0A1G2SPJ9_9BACT|nr:MAG: 50S ribosomal protein L32 [Candidatus Yonathbacteria bacterium RIFOXYC1_FULL_52_10]OHA86311.1 MAG: 50S ribosomal protein L32 [Candidatus Yonathbacteria bacterium RIFOXYD1_FULL_52_36]
MTVRMRHTRAHTGNRRSHHALTAPRLSTCANCQKSHLRHRVCENCGSYRGKGIIDLTAKIEAKQKKRAAKKELATK